MYSLADFKILETGTEPPHMSYATVMMAPQLVWPETKGKGIKVAVLDTGVDITHPDLKVAEAIDFTGEGPNDGNGHGTWCCGAIAANGKMIGIAPEVELYSLKVLKNNGGGEEKDIIKGLKWCLENRIDVISMSLGGPRPQDPAYHDTIKKLYQNGTVIVCAAGNWGGDFPDKDTVVYPAYFPECIAVAAVDIQKKRGFFSSMGPKVEIAAAGVEVWGLWKDRGYAKISGTSMATPAIAAAVALNQAKAKIRKGSKLDPNSLRTYMQLDAEDVGIKGRDREYGFGVYSFARFDENGNLSPDVPPKEFKIDVVNGRLWVDGEEQHWDVKPFVVKGRTMVEMRGLFNALKYEEIIWDPPYAIFRDRR